MVDDWNGHCVCGDGYVWNGSVCVSGSFYCMSTYGIGSQYDYASKNCKCTNFYVWGVNSFGQSYCMSADTSCKNLYGTNSLYDSYSNSCKCTAGFVFQKDAVGNLSCAIDGNTACINNYGINSQYDYASGKCTCANGFIFSYDSYKNLKCLSVNDVCHSTFDVNSSYSPLSSKCECNNGYILLNQSNQCIKKYDFKLLELDTNKKNAIIQNTYDYSNYLIEYGLGCNDGSFQLYKNRLIALILNLDSFISKGDKIVLQNDNQTCEINSVGKVPAGYSLEKISDTVLPAVSPVAPTVAGTITTLPPKVERVNKKFANFNNSYNIRKDPNQKSKIISQTNKKTKYEITDLSNKDWVKIKVAKKEGWVMKKFATIK
ncbi:MAG: SH3 domain-containing protein [Candidatus Falkowbacteria bacterium]